MVEETAEKFFERQNKVARNSNKLLPSLLKFLNKIEKVEQFDAYLKDRLTIPFIDWFLEVFIIRAFLIYFVLTMFTPVVISLPSAFLNHPQRFGIAEGLSLLWFILVQLKQDLWRKQ